MVTLEELRDLITNVSAEIAAIREDFRKLNANTLESLTKIEAKTDSNSEEILVLKQLQLNRSFTLMGLPPPTQDILNEVNIFIKFCSKFGVNITSKDIEKCYVVKHKNGKGSHFYGSFYDLRIRNEVFTKYKEANKAGKKIYIEDIASSLMTAKTAQIRLNSPLIAEYRELLMKARHLYKEKAAFIWSSDGKIFIKMKEESKPIVIKNERELLNLLK